MRTRISIYPKIRKSMAASTNARSAWWFTLLYVLARKIPAPTVEEKFLRLNKSLLRIATKVRVRKALQEVEGSEIDRCLKVREKSAAFFLANIAKQSMPH